MQHQPFLRYVAEDLLAKYGNDLSGVTVVFPNKRASLFLNEHLASLTDKPIWSPRYTTISEMMQQHSPLSLADDIKLICDLHKSFNHCTGDNEPLDKFWGWGTVLLADFDDIDKCLADARAVFDNLRDLHSFDTVSYLSEEQKAVLKRFFSTFDENHESRLREKFLKLWSHFGDVYADFNERLRQQQLTYEGALLRNVVCDDSIDFGPGPYLLVGFNALLPVEQKLFRRLKRESDAHFYWDYDNYYLGNDNHPNEAGTFVSKAIIEFGNELDIHDDAIYANLTTPKRITYIGAPTGNVQARYVGEWLSESSRVEAGNKSAIVMCDETLLPTIVHSITPEVTDLNITTGFPLTHTAAASLVSLLLELRLFGTRGNRYRQKFVNAVLRHPYAVMLSPQAPTLCAELVDRHRFYPSRDELSLDEGLTLLFSDLTKSTDGKTYNEIEVLSQWLLSLLRHIAIEAQAQKPDDPLTHESIFRTYTLLNRLHGLVASGDLATDVITFCRLIRQVMSQTRVPYHGEPAVGLQVMGVLETRNLDFDHLLLLSCNEGNMPQGTDSSSFIPQAIRMGYGLSTIDHTVSLYAYYFYRMLQRATDVTIMYVNAADNKGTGEMSRFMLQLLVEGGMDIARQSIHSEQEPIRHEKVAIEKTSEVLNRLRRIEYLSPTAINRYNRCPLEFYYYAIANIKEPDDVNDEIDNRIFGTIFHDASQFVYDGITGADKEERDEQHPFRLPGHEISKSQIDHVLKEKVPIERAVDKAFHDDFFKTGKGEQPEYNGLQTIHRNVIVHYIEQLLRIDSRLAPFTIRGLEGKVTTTIPVTTSEGKFTVRVGGRIDRLDEVTDSDGVRRIRVIDYKTGTKDLKNFESIDDVFSRNMIHNHADYFLQAMLYSWIVSESAEVNPHQLPVSPALLFIQHAIKDDYSPVLKLNKAPITDMREWNAAFVERLCALIGEIYEPTKPFEPTDDPQFCKLCPYKELCGRVKKD